MHKLVPLIEQVILRSFPEVMEVDFEKINSYLGSSPELPEEERTIEVIRIIVTINNLKSQKNWYDLKTLKKEIIEKVESYFSLDVWKYGSGWDFEFFQAKKERF
jgi:hypothetical protein